MRIVNGPFAGLTAVFDLPKDDGRAQALIEMLDKVEQVVVDSAHLAQYSGWLRSRVSELAPSRGSAVSESHRRYSFKWARTLRFQLFLRVRSTSERFTLLTGS